MTLGGLALAVGILVDDATVAIENINRHLEQGKDARAGDPRRRAADRHAGVRLDALHLHRVRADVLPHRRRALPVRAAGRSGGVRDARLVRPLAHAGADDGEVPAEGARAARRTARRRATRSCGSSARIDRGFVRLRDGYRGAARAVRRRAAASSRRCSSLACVVVARAAAAGSAQDFFPAVDGGQFKLHLRAPTGTRIEETAALCDRVEDAIREIIPARRAREHHRQHRPALQRHQPARTATRRRSAPRDADILVALDDGPPADRRLHPRPAASRCRSAFPASRSRSCRPTSSARS